MCGGSLRDYLKSYDALPALPLVAQVPVSVRAADADDDNGNAISAVQVTLGTDIGNAVDRLRAIQESMKAAKHRLSSMEKADLNAFTVLSNLPLMLGQATGLAGRRTTMFNVVISNVPGPKEPLYMHGAKMLANYPVSLIWHGYAANITVHSYVDSLDFGIIACRDTVPRVQRMLDYLEDALVALENHLPQHA
jgi:diacylglycerol O-acyltransferase